MPRLDETDNLTLRSKRRKADGSEFYEIPVFGDGNCAFNAFALGLIGAIKGGHQIDEDTLLSLIVLLKKPGNLATLKGRIKLYRGERSNIEGNQYSDLADSLEQLVNFFERNKLDPGGLIQFIKRQNTRIEIAALHVAFAPALREMSLNLRDDHGAKKEETGPLRIDGIDAGDQELKALSNEFGLNIDICQTNNKTIAPQIKQEAIDPAKRTMHILHAGNHWNLLIKPDEKKYFAMLPDLTAAHKPPEGKLLDSSSRISEWLSTPTDENARRVDEFWQANRRMNKLLDDNASPKEVHDEFTRLSAATKPQSKL